MLFRLGDNEWKLEVQCSGEELANISAGQRRLCTFKFCNQFRLVKLLSSNDTSSVFLCMSLDCTCNNFELHDCVNLLYFQTSASWLCSLQLVLVELPLNVSTPGTVPIRLVGLSK